MNMHCIVSIKFFVCTMYAMYYISTCMYLTMDVLLKFIFVYIVIYCPNTLHMISLLKKKKN